MALTPMMRQYLEIKDKYNDCVLFFRVGDFYEMFFDDAKEISRELELVLTGKDCGLEERAPMCGIPFHAANSYIQRLVHKGYKVAICEQVEDPQTAKGLVKRDVIKIITPGTYIDNNATIDNLNTYLVCIYEDGDRIGLASTDISTGEFKVTSFNNLKATLLDELTKIAPKEIIVDNSISEELLDEIVNATYALITKRNLHEFNVSNNELIRQFSEVEVSDLDESANMACRVLLKYIFETQKISLTNINFLESYDIVNFMTIDGSSRKNLELTMNIHEKTKKGSLLWVLDKTATAMGARALRRIIDEPLIIKEEIEKRLDGVEELFNNISLNDDLRIVLKDIYDIERIVGKISSANVNAKDMISLKSSLEKIPNIKKELKNVNSSLLVECERDLDELRDVYELLDKAIIDEPSLSIKEGNIIKEGYSEEIDELRQAKLHGKEWIAALESSEREETGIKSLKVGYNKVFGYYIEITKANYSMIPEGRYIRKQTLSNAERFITPELKEVEEKILGSEEKLISLEYDLFVDVRNKVEREITRLKKSARIIGNLDAFSTLALVALENDYVKPTINDEGIIDIKEGRHPVVEKVINKGEFVANDTYLNTTTNELLIITGPNMAGKSTFMRQVALITLMAQMGSFVPCKSANISICDKIFTRIGASDDLAGGKSTFMVEMWEVSNILKNATPKSLVLLDEVGRGTSTYDGLSIAWAVIEHICNSNNLKCKTLFATHYHELTKLEGTIDGVKNYSVAVKEIEDNVIFLRKIIEGGADQSYGIEVAKLAGIPDDVIKRAKEILEDLESNKVEIAVAENNTKVKEVVKEVIKEVPVIKEVIKEVPAKENDNMQLDFAAVEKENLIEEIASYDILNMNPMEAMNTLYSLVKKAKEFK
ncbi:DNA mismatch repair protein MutS [Clostridium sp. MSJ-8]|uniref:DNA mismatch repair protein MutS n=1 Tax=Clostridium sp. MSJ-8 TaxID=2841510 RepID=UPI001C0EE320|nr:DNA mismatch repair protein MutS [Clostridium sp. MSJ-8]MBU5487662.1 DNA mismatch repair protein MutS [Clostridium sp. MSJ-8]